MNTRTRTFRAIAAAGTLLLAGGTLAACGDDDSDSTGSDSTGSDSTGSEESSQDTAAEVTISDPWARTGTAGGNSAVYMEITGGTEPSDLVAASVSTDVAAEAQIHETMAAGGMADEEGTGDSEMSDEGTGDDMGDGMMTMQEVSAIAIPAGESVSLEPGGFHIMLLDLAEDLSTGDSVEVTLSFENGYTETVTAEVRES